MGRQVHVLIIGPSGGRLAHRGPARDFQGRDSSTRRVPPAARTGHAFERPFQLDLPVACDSGQGELEALGRARDLAVAVSRCRQTSAIVLAEPVHERSGELCGRTALPAGGEGVVVESLRAVLGDPVKVRERWSRNLGIGLLRDAAADVLW